ncbi:hypothetical protein HMPREF9446_00719 [Bacteroides fluxus YIT 12057]|uniref:Uncharacterized protein n=1 Tax=Bacteroides fluxus YIT 12057 TaxID=763034 RepID=F3PPS8_9BACE|nr:hypothetical protein HMPREF9446_00719 [Bacteroides fluxus YIT 12057]
MPPQDYVTIQAWYELAVSSCHGQKNGGLAVCGVKRYWFWTA